MPGILNSAIPDATSFLKEKLCGRRPLAGIILGSGLDGLSEEIADKTTIPFTDVPGFPAATALGHKGNFIIGTLGSKTVLAMEGRYHFYEGRGTSSIALPIRVMAGLGIKYLLVSNAVGSMNPDYRIGDLVLIKDHISMIPNPLIGPNLAEFGPRFPDMTCVYDDDLQKRMVEIADAEEIEIRRGIYVSATGPCYETPAEYKYFRIIGGDIVGMSVTPEVTVARHCGIKVLGMSVVTDLAHETTDVYVTDENEIIEQAAKASHKMTRLFRRLISEL